MEFQPIRVRTQAELEQQLGALPLLSYLALDLETAYWWRPQEEYIALLQLAYRDVAGNIVVLLLEVQGLSDPQPLQELLEDPKLTVVIHNASYDAVKLQRAYGIRTRAIHDTMRAARRAGAKHYSLAALVQDYFGIALDKTEQQSDWSRQPFTPNQLSYAAKDAVYTLLIYEQQRKQGLSGSYELPGQDELPWLTEPLQPDAPTCAEVTQPLSLINEVAPLGLAALGLVVKKPNYYSPASLVVAIGKERSGLAGWIVNTLVGEQVEIEEREAQQIIAKFLTRGWLTLDSYARCEASPAGHDLWHLAKPTAIP